MNASLSAQVDDVNVTTTDQPDPAPRISMEYIPTLECRWILESEARDRVVAQIVDLVLLTEPHYSRNHRKRLTIIWVIIPEIFGADYNLPLT